jgi:hypothetical protein
MYWLLFKHQRTFKVPLTNSDIYERLVKWYRRISLSTSQTVKYSEKDNHTFESTLQLNIKSENDLIRIEFNLTIYYDSTFYKTTFEDFYIYYATDPEHSRRTALQTETEWNIVKKYVDNVQNSIYKNVMIG